MSLRETTYDPFTGTTSEWHFDGTSIVQKKSVDLSALVANCQEQQMVQSGFSDRETKFHKVASLPPIVVEKIMKEHRLDVFSSEPADQKKLERIIEQEYPFLKTNSSKLWRPT